MVEVLRERIRFTYKDYINLPDNGKRYQVIDGEVYMVPAPAPDHQRILLKLGKIVDDFVNKNGLGEVFLAPCDVVLSDEDIVQPDIFFISKERSGIVTKKNVHGAPDLIIEVLSPHTEKLDRTLKRRLYEKYMVKEYWIVSQDSKKVEILVLRKEGYKKNKFLESSLLKGLKIDLKEIF